MFNALIKMLPHLNAEVAKHYFQQKILHIMTIDVSFNIETCLRTNVGIKAIYHSCKPSLYTNYYKEILSKCNAIIHQQNCKSLIINCS